MDFLNNTPPEYGYKNNDLETWGSVLMTGTKLAVERLRSADSLIETITAVAIGILSLPLTAVGALIKGVGKLLPHPFVQETDQVYTRTDPRKLDKVYTILKRLDQELQNAGIFYISEAGTQLGATRHGGVIPWDDDGDINVKVEDRDRLEEVLNELEQQGFTVIRQFGGLYQVILEEDGVQGHVDIFLISKQQDERWRYASGHWRSVWPKHSYSDADLESVVRQDFGPKKSFQLNLLRDPKAYLDGMYGPDWNEYGIATHDHRKWPWPLDFITYWPANPYRVKLTDLQPGEGSQPEWQRV